MSNTKARLWLYGVASVATVVMSSAWAASCTGGGSSLRAACARLCDCFGSASSSAASCVDACVGSATSTSTSGASDACYDCIADDSHTCAEIFSSGGACEAACGSSTSGF